MRIDKLLLGIARTFISAGVLVFLFVGYQLWGTSFAESRAQSQLKSEAKAAFSSDTTSTSPATPGESTSTTAPPPVPQGAAVAMVRIPKIGVEKAVVAGTSVADLKKGPGHYSETPMPGQRGNVGIAGHRTTYGAPFNRIDELNEGDEIDITTRDGSFIYRVTSQRIVTPDNISVLDQGTNYQLTLTTCHPKFSDAQRLIVFAELENPPAQDPAPGASDAPKPAPVVDLGDATLSGTAVNKEPVYIWGAVCAIFAMFAWTVARRLNKIAVYTVSAPIFLFFLYHFFENFSRLLPANA